MVGQSRSKNGGKGIRTPDIQLAKLALYQLSYAPVNPVAQASCYGANGRLARSTWRAIFYQCTTICNWEVCFAHSPGEKPVGPQAECLAVDLGRRHLLRAIDNAKRSGGMSAFILASTQSEIRICGVESRVDGTQEVSRAYPERAVIGSENWCG